MEDLLGSAVALAAGLSSRFDHDYITGQFQALRLHHTKVAHLHRRLVCGVDKVRYRGMRRVASLLQGLRSQRVIFAGSQFGPILAGVAALASIGAKVAGVYSALSGNNARILRNCRANFIDLNRYKTGFSILEAMRQLHSDGYVIWLMCDLPGQSRVHCEFMGYNVRCASLLEVYARVQRCSVVPSYCRVLSDREVSMECGAPLTDYNNMTQCLLSELETLIYEEPINYLWQDSCIVFSDPRALPNGLRCLPEFLEWRDRAAARNRQAGSASVMA